MKDGAPLLHKKYANNVLAHTDIRRGNYEEAIKEPGLVKLKDGMIHRPFSTAT